MKWLVALGLAAAAGALLRELFRAADESRF